MTSLLSEYRAAFRTWSSNIHRLLLSMFLSSIATGIIGLLANFYFLGSGYSENQLGTLMAIGSFVTAATAVPAGLLADRYPRHRIIQIATVTMAGGFGLFLLARGVWTLYAAQAVTSLAEAFLGVTIGAYMTDNSHDSNRTHLFTIQFLQWQVVNAAGTYVGGYLPTWLGGVFRVNAESVDAYRIALTLALGLFVASIFPLLKLTAGAGSSPATPASENAPAAAAPKRGFSLIKHPRELGFLTLNGFLIGFGAGLFVRFLNVIINKRYGLDVSSIGSVYAIQGVASIAAALIVPRLSNLRGRVTTAWGLQMASLPFLFAMAVTPSATVFIAAMIIRGVLMNVANPVLDSFAMSILDRSERATANSVRQMAWMFAWSISAKVTGWMMDSGDYTTMFWAAGFLYLVGISLFRWAFKSYETRSAEPSVAA